MSRLGETEHVDVRVTVRHDHGPALDPGELVEAIADRLVGELVDSDDSVYSALDVEGVPS